MAECRRLQLEPAAPMESEKKCEDLPTVRLDIKLDCESCNEFSYRELLLEEEERAKKKDDDELDPFGGEDDDEDKIQKIAKKLEEKYNPKAARKKRKKGTFLEDEYIDRGTGYDETDPFIDNGEAYDELVPCSLSTEFGGFYVNMGTLEFKNASENENTVDIKSRKKRRRPKDDKDLKKRRRIGMEGDQIPKRRGRRPTPLPAVSALAKIKKKTQPTVADMLQQHKAQIQLQQQEQLQQIQNAPITVERNIVEVLEVKSENIEQTANIGQGLNSTILDAIESVVKASAEEATSNGSIVTGSSDGEEMVIKLEKDAIVPKLPENLPSDLDGLVKKLTQAAYNSEEGKCKFFSNEVNNMLLSVELKSQELTSTQRSTIYSHLASHLPCTKETLQKRAKKLRLDQEDNKLREPMQKLKDAIAAVLPGMIEKHEQALKSPPETEKCDMPDLEMPPLTDEETDDDDDDSSNLPKRIFEWDDATRGFLCDVVRIKLKCYEVTKTRIQSAEEYLKTFFRAEVKPLWPKGWMYARILLRESREAHFHVTNRLKKTLMMAKKPVPPAILALKPSLAALNSAIIPQESNMEPAVQNERCVPSNPLLYDVERKSECIRTSVADDIKQADLIKLLTYPIKNPVFENSLTSQVSANIESKLIEPVSPKNTVISSHMKTPEQVSPSQLPNKQTVLLPNKGLDLNKYADGSLASDMLACIIRASLADFPYAGSSNADNLSLKNKTVITSGASFMQAKDASISNSKLQTDSFTSPKRSEDPKPVKQEVRKPSQEVSSSILLSGGTMESIINSHLVNKPSDIAVANLFVKNKGMHLEPLKSPVNLKLSSVIDSRQFADAFERTEHMSPTKKPTVKHQISKMMSPNLRYMPTSSAVTSLVFSSSKESALESLSSASAKTITENPQRISLDYTSKTTPSLLAPFKKRTKYAQSTKNIEKWPPYLETGINASLLEGMKGFPFPVNTPPTPPPAHCSTSLKTSTQIKDNPYVLHSQQSSRSSSIVPNSSLIRLEAKGSYSRTVEPSSHSPHQGHIRLPIAESTHRQSQIKSPWQTSQSSSTSLSQFPAANQLSLLNSKSTSPTISGSNAHQNPTIVYAHSQSASTPPEKSTFSHTQNQLPAHASHSTVQGLSSSRTSPSSVHLQHISQASFLVHQPSHSTSTHQVPAHCRSNTSFVHTHPSSTSSSITGTYTFSQEQKANPRPN